MLERIESARESIFEEVTKLSFKVEGKVALVTGANRGIGLTIVRKLLAAGASKVYAAVRKPESVMELVEQADGRVVAVQIELSNPESIQAAAELTGDVELVINNAGVLKVASPFAASAIEDLGYEMDINVFGLMRMAQAFAPILKSNGGGAFVQLNSVASLRSFADFCTYAASKAAAYSMTQAIRDKLKDQSTQVVSVHPGPISTDMADSAGLTDIAESPDLVADGIVEALAKGEFHLFPDSMAKNFWSSYEPFARQVVEQDISE